jgi:hypothetical protein
VTRSDASDQFPVGVPQIRIVEEVVLTSSEGISEGLVQQTDCLFRVKLAK